MVADPTIRAEIRQEGTTDSENAVDTMHALTIFRLGAAVLFDTVSKQTNFVRVWRKMAIKRKMPHGVAIAIQKRRTLRVAIYICDSHKNERWVAGYVAHWAQQCCCGVSVDRHEWQ